MTIRVLHYINQFFAGIGGEDYASTKPEIRLGKVGPGILLEQALTGRGQIVATLICGDNYASEHPRELEELAQAAVDEHHVQLLVAGPAFNSGRYGMACGTVCAAVQVPSVTGLHLENPAVDAFRARTYVIPTTATGFGMASAMANITRLGLKLATGQRLGPAADEGYFAQGLRRNLWRADPAAKRALDLLMAKVRGEPWQSEIELPVYGVVVPAAPVGKSARVALATEGGLVPAKNPDGLEGTRCTKWTAYGLERLGQEPFVSVHGGYDSRWVDADPNRMIPYDAARDVLHGRLAETFFSTVGCGMPVGRGEEFGAEMAAVARQQGIEAIILSAT